MAKMIAKTVEGKEFMYSRVEAYEVSNAGAEEICKALNEKRWHLDKPEEKWHVYDLGWYEREQTQAGVQKLGRRKGSIYVTRAGNGW